MPHCASKTIPANSNTFGITYMITAHSIAAITSFLIYARSAIPRIIDATAVPYTAGISVKIIFRLVGPVCSNKNHALPI